MAIWSKPVTRIIGAMCTELKISQKNEWNDAKGLSQGSHINCYWIIKDSAQPQLLGGGQTNPTGYQYIVRHQELSPSLKAPGFLWTLLLIYGHDNRCPSRLIWATFVRITLQTTEVTQRIEIVPLSGSWNLRDFVWSAYASCMPWMGLLTFNLQYA